MTRLVWSPILIPPDALVVLDADRRLYAGLSHDESYYHLIQPTQFAIVDPNTDEVLRTAGALACTCRGFQSHGHCYQTQLAIELEIAKADQAAAPSWLGRVAPETELERAAARG
jgi:hypothetical protein